MKKILVGLTALVIGLSAMAQKQERNGRPEGRGGERKEMMEKLNLSEEQKAKMKEIREEGKKQMEELKGQGLSEDAMKDKRKALMESNREKIKAVLTPEQQKQWEAMKPEMGRPESGEGVKEHGGNKDGDFQEMIKDLNLTPEQTTKMKAANMAMRDKVKEIQANTTLTADQKKEQTKGIRKDYKASLKQILTPGQLEKMKDHRKEGHE